MDSQHRERQLNRRLTLGMVLTALLYALLVCLAVWVEGRFLETLVLSFSAVPFLFLQARLCRLQRHRRLRWLPIGLLFLAAGLCALTFFGVLGTGWDFLFGGIGLLFCIAPAVGVALGWLAAGTRAEQILGAAGIAAFAAAYVAARACLGEPLFLLDLPMAAMAAAGVFLLLCRRRQQRQQRQQRAGGLPAEELIFTHEGGCGT